MTRPKLKDNMLALTVILGIFAITALGVVWSGFALSILWGWFIVPTFGLTTLSIPSAIGVAIMLEYVTHQYQKKNSSDVEGLAAFGDVIVQAMLRPAIALLVGWIVKQWL